MMRRFVYLIFAMTLILSISAVYAQEPEVTPFPVNQASAVGFAYGAQVYLPGQDANAVVGQLNDLGVSWVNHRVDWSEFEATRGAISFDRLDAIVQPLDAAGLNILLTITNAPTWARNNNVDGGPPIVNNDFAAFVGAVAGHYAGVVDAYEIWSEPNLRANWTGKPINGAEYMNLLKVAYNAIKAADPAAVVVSAGLAPTQTNDPEIAINDRDYLRQMYANGLADFSDAVGAHAGGWANPPDSKCCGNIRPAVPGWDDQKAFFFLDTIQDYRAIMGENNDDGTFLWVTGFGWGSSDGVAGSVNERFAFVNLNDQIEQGQFIGRAFQLGRDLTYIGPMMVDNLNYCGAFGMGGVECYWSLLDGAGNPRPSFEVVKLVIPD